MQTKLFVCFKIGKSVHKMLAVGKLYYYITKATIAKLYYMLA